jgi:ribosome-associated translation inhibitor RaiA
MFKQSMVALVTLMTLAGCGRAIAPNAQQLQGTTVQARVNTSTKSALIYVPKSVFNYVEDHLAKLNKQYDEPDQKVYATVKLVASRDNFKHDKHEYTFSQKQVEANDTERYAMLGMLNGDIAPGDYEYYLVVTGMVVKQVNNRAYMDTLDDFFVSNYGKNYKVTLK